MGIHSIIYFSAFVGSEFSVELLVTMALVQRSIIILNKYTVLEAGSLMRGPMLGVRSHAQEQILSCSRLDYIEISSLSSWRV